MNSATQPRARLDRVHVNSRKPPNARKACRGYIVASGPRGERVVRRAHGGRRSCTDDQCRMRYAKRVFARAIGGVREAMRAGFLVKMVTLTLPARIVVNGESIDPTGPLAFRYMARRFNAFMATARVRWPMLYIRFVELQDRGAPHYHLLVATRAWIDKRELSALAERVGLGPIVDVSLVRSATRAANYVTTYVTKEAGSDVPRRFRFYVTSRLFGVEAREDAVADAALRLAGWSFAYVRQADADSVLAELAALGFTIEEDPEPPPIPVASEPRSNPPGSHIEQLPLRHLHVGQPCG